ncbi:MAG: RnfABCDGE type electron transport complex subunit B [Clostridiaceae bacterium]|nr:RnfABCDGE type electron transport complex subunit B [Clostridiaceae bacterium]
MEFIGILRAVAVLGALGLGLGALLALASRVFAVKTDERVEKIIHLLPGANCGGCGFAGCGAFANAVVKGEASASDCVAGGRKYAVQIAEVLGTTVATPPEQRVAVIQCSGGTHIMRRYEYVGIQSCFAASRMTGGPTECAFACLGFGDCAKACKFGGIRFEHHAAVVHHESCVGCGKCEAACPRKLIVLAPARDEIRYVGCSSRDRGSIVRSLCNAGCIGCMLCMKKCPSGAIRVADNLARIDSSLCTGCGACEAVCPRKIIHRVMTPAGAEYTVETQEVLS